MNNKVTQNRKFNRLIQHLYTIGLLINYVQPLMAQEALQEYDYWAQLCQTQAADKQYAEAIKACDHALSLNPNDVLLWQKRAGILLAMQDYTQAVVAYEQVLRRDANNPEAWTKQCQANYHLNNYQKAIAECETALRLEAQFPALAWYYRGEAFRQLNQFEDALFSYHWAVQLQANFSPAALGECIVFFKKKDYQKALQACQQARQDGGEWGDIDPALAWVYEAKIYREWQQYPQALSAYEQALVLDTKDATIWTEQGEILNILGRNQEAFTSHRWAVQLSPQYSRALTNLCTTLNYLNQKQRNQQPAPEGDYQKALEACDQALQNDDQRWEDFNPATAWNQRGNALMGLGKYDEGLSSIDRALTLAPDYAEAWNNKAVALWLLKQYPEALTSVETALKLNPQFSEAWYNKGKILTTLRRYLEASDAYQQALLGDNAQRQDPTVSANILVNQSAVLWRLKFYQEALIAAENAISLQPNSPEALYNQSLALIALKRYSQAQETLKTLLKIDPNNAQAKKSLEIVEQYLTLTKKQ